MPKQAEDSPTELVARRTGSAPFPRIGILIVAYNAVSTIASVLDRIPADVWPEVSEVAVFDDASHDATHDLARMHGQTRRLDKLSVVRNAENLGYGGNQKAGYQYFVDRGFDVVVLLHGDGQYAPEVLREMYRPIVEGNADAVFGSRMMSDYGGPLKGGMPLYKYAGNRILTTIENWALGTALTEFHSGYRAYSIAALEQIDLSNTTDDFHFDTQIIVKFQHQRLRIKEVPIPTYYGDEICHVDGIRYAKDVVRSVMRYRRTVGGSRRPAAEYAEYAPHYPLKLSPCSSHALAASWVGSGKRVLDLGCGEGWFADIVARQGNDVVGVDVLPRPKARDSMTDYMAADLDRDLDQVRARFAGAEFDTVLLLDVLEHLGHGSRLLDLCREFLAPTGTVVISVPNVANLSVRLSLLAGRWTYTERGILDRTHVRFYTGRSARQLAQSLRYEIVRGDVTPIPFEVALGVPPTSSVVSVLGRGLGALTRLWPGGLGYQTLLELRDASGH